MSTNNTILGVIVGLAIGATAGVLLAPDKGEVTRNKIKSKVKKSKNNLQDSFDEFIATVTEKFESIKQEGEELLHKEKEELKNKI
jgi:gas vesicle protein